MAPDGKKRVKIRPEVSYNKGRRKRLTTTAASGRIAGQQGGYSRMRRIVTWSLALGAVAWVGSLGAQPLVLGGRAEAAASPQLAVAPDGVVHLVHEGLLGESQGVIVHQTWEAGAWSEEEIIASMAGVQCDPALAIGDDGTVHVAWSATLEERLALLHRARRDGAWGPLRILDAGLESHSEFPAIAARPDGGAEIVWQSGQGLRYQIAHTSVAPDGTLTPARVLDGQSADGFNVYPQIFLTPTPVVAWHEAVGVEFRLRAAEWVPGPAWRRLPLADLLLIDTDRLPCLLLSDLGQWAALWYDTVLSHDRILLGRGGEPDFGLGEIVDASEALDNVAPRAVAMADDQWAVAWRGETPHGPEIFLALEGLGGWRQIMLSGGQTPAAAQPALCVANGAVHVAWTSDVLEGGDGRLRHITLPLR